MTKTHLPHRSGAARPGAFTLIELLVTLAVIGILAALLLPAIARAKRQANNITCINQLKQLGVATRLFAEDNNGRLPVAEALPSNPDNPQEPKPRICDVLGPYVGKAATTNHSAPVFKCPSDHEWFFEAEGSSYQWNTSLNGKAIDFSHIAGKVTSTLSSNGVIVWQTNFTLVQAPESASLLLDYDDFHRRPPKSGKNAVYMDGHATAFVLTAQ